MVVGMEALTLEEAERSSASVLSGDSSSEDDDDSWADFHFDTPSSQSAMYETPTSEEELDSELAVDWREENPTAVSATANQTVANSGSVQIPEEAGFLPPEPTVSAEVTEIEPAVPRHPLPSDVGTGDVAETRIVQTALLAAEAARERGEFPNIGESQPQKGSENTISSATATDAAMSCDALTEGDQLAAMPVPAAETVSRESGISQCTTAPKNEVDQEMETLSLQMCLDNEGAPSSPSNSRRVIWEDRRIVELEGDEVEAESVDGDEVDDDVDVDGESAASTARPFPRNPDVVVGRPPLMYYQPGEISRLADYAFGVTKRMIYEDGRIIELEGDEGEDESVDGDEVDDDVDVYGESAESATPSLAIKVEGTSFETRSPNSVEVPFPNPCSGSYLKVAVQGVCSHHFDSQTGLYVFMLAEGTSLETFYVTPGAEMLEVKWCLGDGAGRRGGGGGGGGGGGANYNFGHFSRYF
ncbi:hypothetical protein DFJ73DRAFT_370612 [Zopfochytrium polystomum]|nr:hypothetical protein DFJ73DRAFT_370612 [Zopfochytrium polystomum]